MEEAHLLNTVNVMTYWFKKYSASGKLSKAWLDSSDSRPSDRFDWEW